MGGELRRLTKFIPQVQAGCDFNFAWADNKSHFMTTIHKSGQLCPPKSLDIYLAVV